MVKENSLTKKDIQELLNNQTGVILDAVDERIMSLETRLNKKLEAMEARWNRKFDKLTTTLDKFLKRLTDTEDEFTIMKHDVSNMKKIIREKLGVEV